MLKMLVRKVYKTIRKKVERIRKNFIRKFKVKSIIKDLDTKAPRRVIKRHGIRFDVKEIDAIVCGSQAALTVSEVAAVYATSKPNVYVIGVDKTFKKLSSRTKRFVLEHEMAHITYGLNNPKGKLSIETQVDMIAAYNMKMTTKQLRKCLREIKDKSRYLSSKKIMIKRLKNIR